MATFWTILKNLPTIFAVLSAVLKIFDAAIRYKLTEEATKEMLHDLELAGAVLVARAANARANVPVDTDSVSHDPYNKERVGDNQARPEAD